MFCELYMIQVQLLLRYNEILALCNFAVNIFGGQKQIITKKNKR